MVLDKLANLGEGRKLKNLKGGIDAWSKQVDPGVARY